MKAVIYTRVSTKDQTTQRQVNDLNKVEFFEVIKTFSENISGFSKSMEERKGLQDMLKYVRKNGIDCIMVSEVSRLGRNTVECLNLMKELEDQGICLYIHNLGCTIGKDCGQDSIFTKLIVTIMADLARMESEQLSQRIKSGIRNRKANGLATGRQVNSTESKERFLSKHKDVQKYLSLGRSYAEISKLTGAAPTTISKVKKALAGEMA